MFFVEPESGDNSKITFIVTDDNHFGFTNETLNDCLCIDYVDNICVSHK